MRINNNIMAMNAHRQLGVNQANSSKSMERLSSGLRINRAGDDAAGLAISEKMRGQIRGLKQASRNAQDAISLIQTAEGALNETHAILQRMRELATQSASDTNTEVDRGEIQKEINELAAEITRIADTTEFNTQNLLGGEFSGIFHIGANEGQNITLAINAMDADTLGVAGASSGVQLDEFVQASVSQVAAGAISLTHGNFVEYTVEKLDSPVTIAEGDLAQSGADVEVHHVMKNAAGEIVAVGDKTGTNWYIADSAAESIGDLSFTQAAAIVSFTSGIGVTSGTIEARVDATDDTTDGGIEFQTASAVAIFGEDSEGLASGTYTVSTSYTAKPEGATSVLLDSRGVVVGSSTNDTAFTDLYGNSLFTLSAPATDGQELTVQGAGGIDVSSQASADKAITVLNDAIETVSAERSKLGAYQNRLEHTIANLGTSAENLQAAESRIRDLDMAEEIMAFTKNNILQQAATAMLAQANMAPQSVLQLLG